MHNCVYACGYFKKTSSLILLATHQGEIAELIELDLPTGNIPVTVNLGSRFKAEPGETYIFSFVGYADGVPVCRDDCCIVGGYE